MKEVLVWVSYGKVSVYSIETYDEIRELVNTIINCLDGWELDDAINEARQYMKQWSPYAALYVLVTAINSCDDGHESFEKLVFVDVIAKSD